MGMMRDPAPGNDPSEGLRSSRPKTCRIVTCNGYRLGALRRGVLAANAIKLEIDRPRDRLALSTG
jgi:hypothetical protein